ncbi:MAG: SipW-dependent-type signal peptide-containing protein [Candidatus Paceibacterota bacterium]
MKKIIKSLAVLVVVGAIATGATLAYFSDTETSTGNTITAGSLNLQLECPEATTADMDSLHPEDVTIDTTGTVTDQLTPTELAMLSASDDSSYTSNYGWYTSFGAPTDGPQDDGWHMLEFIDFAMADIPTGATVTDASLKFEWQRGTGVNDARIRVYDGSTWQTVDLALPTANTDVIENINLYTLGFTTKAKIDALRIQFQATQDGSWNQNDVNSKTKHDLVEVNASYTTTSAPYWCDDGLTGQFNITNIKPTDTGTTATIKYQNEGNINGTLKLKVSNVVDNENTLYSPESVAGDLTGGATEGEMSQYLKLLVNGTPETFAQLATGVDLGPLDGGDNGQVYLSWSFPDATGINQAQSDGTTFNIDFVLEQNP